MPELKDRIRCLFFLATPHRGSDYASTLSNILTVSGVMSPRHYVNDLMTGSSSIQTINDDFGRIAHDMPIFSFYETLRTSIGVTSSLIVDKSSAVLGKSHPLKNDLNMFTYWGRGEFNVSRCLIWDFRPGIPEREGPVSGREPSGYLQVRKQRRSKLRLSEKCHWLCC